MTILPLRTVADATHCWRAVQAHLAAAGLIAYPTETVYGLGSALLPGALERLVRFKGRTDLKPFLLLHAQPDQLPGLTWTPAARLLAERFWPGPLTIALAADDRYPPAVRSAAGTVAVRDGSLAPLRTLLGLLGLPITSTSANLPGADPATALPELRRILDQIPDAGALLVLDGGALPASPPSTVVDCSGANPRLLRAGAVSVDELRAVLEPEGFAFDGG